MLRLLSEPLLMSYSPKLLDHFRNPRNAGELANPSAVAEASNPVCGDVMKIWLRVERGRITAATFKAAGCVPVIACGSWLAERISKGCTVQEALRLKPEEIGEGLGGIPGASEHAPLLATDVLRKALGFIASGQLPTGV